MLGRAWFAFLRLCGVAVSADGEYAPFGEDDERRVDGAVAGFPEAAWDLCAWTSR